MIVKIRLKEDFLSRKDFDALQENFPDDISEKKLEDYSKYLSDEEKAAGLTEIEKQKQNYDEDAERRLKGVILKNYYGSFLTDLNFFMSITSHNVSFEVVERIPTFGLGTTYGHGGQVQEALQLPLLQAVQQIAERVGTLNEKVGVHITDNELLRIRNLKVVTDACTDHIKEQLDAGWQIVAVCPQPNQRRPDYVLGETSGLREL